MENRMSEDRFDLRNLELREIIPWVHLFRGFSIAQDLKKIALGVAGVVVMFVGWWMIASVLIGKEPTPPVALKAEATPEEKVAYEKEYRAYQVGAERYHLLGAIRRFPWVLDPAHDYYRSPLNGGWKRGFFPSAALLVLEPIRLLTLPARLMFHSSSSSIAGLLLTAWTLLTWSLFGGATARIAAVEVARETQVGLGEAIRFVGSRFPSYLGAPVLPFLGVVLIVVFCAIGGVLTWIPVADIVMGVFWFLALVAGFVMTVALLGLLLGWPLMYSAIGAEATESFDALSRSYSYVLGRPGHYLFYIIIATAFGAIIMTIAATIAYVIIWLSQFAVSWGGGDVNLRNFYAFVPTAGGWRDSFGPITGAPTGTRYLTAVLVGFWTHLLFLALLGFAFSYFWSSATIIYFLLRQDVDETELEEVFLEEEEDEPFPTVAPSLAATGSEPPASSGGLNIIDPPR